MIKKMLLFSFLYSVCHTMSLHCAQKADFGYSLLFCTGGGCDFKFPYLLFFLFLLGFFIFRTGILFGNGKGIKAIISCVLFTVLISIIYSFLASGFYVLGLQGDLLSHEFGFLAAMSIVRTMALFFLLLITRSIFKRITHWRKSENTANS